MMGSSWCGDEVGEFGIVICHVEFNHSDVAQHFTRSILGCEPCVVSHPWESPIHFELGWIFFFLHRWNDTSALCHPTITSGIRVGKSACLTFPESREGVITTPPAGHLVDFFLLTTAGWVPHRLANRVPPGFSTIAVWRDHTEVLLYGERGSLGGGKTLDLNDRRGCGHTHTHARTRFPDTVNAWHWHKAASFGVSISSRWPAKPSRFSRAPGSAHDLEHHRRCRVGLDVNPQQGTFGWGWWWWGGRLVGAFTGGGGPQSRCLAARSLAPSRPAVRAWSRLVAPR